VVGKEGEDLSRHDKWLCMMYPRLKLLHMLLASDGVFVTSIDENEYHVLKLVLDEIFGRYGYLGSICLKTRNTDNRVKTRLSVDHEYIIVYSKGAPIQGRIIDRSDFKNPDDDPRGPYVTDPLTGKATAEDRPNLHYDIVHPITGDLFPPDPARGWITDRQGYEKLLAEDKIWWPPNPSTGKPRKKRFLFETSERMPVSSFWADTKGQTGADELDKILGERLFAFPKSVDFMCRLLDVVCDKDSVILDSYAGSGTTAHAVLKLNSQDEGNRRFISVEMMNYAETITAERVRRVMAGYGEDNKTVAALGGSFEYYTIGETLFDEDGNLKEAVPVEEIRRYVAYTEGIDYVGANLVFAQQYDRPQTGQSQGLPLQNHHPSFLGTFSDAAYFFHYEPDRATTLDHEYLSTLTFPDNRKPATVVIYADNCLLSQEQLRKHGIIFKKIPRDIKRF
jgi:hypothetical protein